MILTGILHELGRRWAVSEYTDEVTVILSKTRRRDLFDNILKIVRR